MFLHTSTYLIKEYHTELSGYIKVDGTATTTASIPFALDASFGAVLTGTSASFSNSVHTYSSAAGVGFFSTTTSIDSGGSFIGRSSNGTILSPAATLANDHLASFGSRGHNGSGFTSTMSAAIRFRASENFNATSSGTLITFETTPNGTATRLERGRVESSGVLTWWHSANFSGNITASDATLSTHLMTLGQADLRFQALSSNLTTIAGLNTNGLLRRTGGVWGIDTATYLTGNQTISITGDATGSGTGVIMNNAALGNPGTTSNRHYECYTVSTARGYLRSMAGDSQPFVGIYVNLQDHMYAGSVHSYTQARVLYHSFSTKRRAISSNGYAGEIGGKVTKFTIVLKTTMPYIGDSTDGQDNQQFTRSITGFFEGFDGTAVATNSGSYSEVQTATPIISLGDPFIMGASGNTGIAAMGSALAQAGSSLLVNSGYGQSVFPSTASNPNLVSAYRNYPLIVGSAIISYPVNNVVNLSEPSRYARQFLKRDLVLVGNTIFLSESVTVRVCNDAISTSANRFTERPCIITLNFEIDVFAGLDATQRLNAGLET